MNLITLPHRSAHLLLKCILFSLAIHVLMLLFFYFNPLILQGPFASLFTMTAATPTSIDMQEEDLEVAQDKDQMLQEVFEQILMLSPHFQEPYDLAQLPKGMVLAPHEELIVPLSSQPLALPEPISSTTEFVFTFDPASLDSTEKSFPSFFSYEESPPPVASQLQIDPQLALSEISIIAPFKEEAEYEDVIAISQYSLHATFETENTLNLSSESSLREEHLQFTTDKAAQVGRIVTDDLHLEHEKIRSTLFIPKTIPFSPEIQQLSVLSSLPDLDQYDLPQMAMTAEWNEDFDLDVAFLPHPEGQGYIFSVSIQPSSHSILPTLKQNLYFIVDRSHLIQKHRFAVFKRAVLKALASMDKNDTFNIIILDKKLETFSVENRPVTPKNIHAAEEFLNQQEAAGLFTSGDLYTALEKVLSLIPENEEMHTGILLTDGKSSLNSERKQKALKKWIDKNNGKFALHTAAIGRDNDLVALDMLSFVSGGKLLYSDTHASFPRKLAKLILDLKDPLAKEMKISAIPHHSDSRIDLPISRAHLPALYSHHPYLLVGHAEEPCTFDLILQGRHGNQWVCIKKTISLNEEEIGSQTLKSEWEAQHANLCYAKFLQEGKVVHLKEAKEILKKSRHEIAFE